MKKILLALALALMLTGCATAEKLTVESLQQATSREDLAKKLNCDITDLKNIITNLENLYKNLPESSDPNKKDTETKYTRDGEICIPKEELMTYIEKIDITPDNWKDIFEIRTFKDEDTNAFGDVTYSYEYTRLTVKDNYWYGYVDSVDMKLHDNVNDKDVVLSSLYLEPYSSNNWYNGDSFNEGDILYSYYEEENYMSYYCVFDMDNFTCTQAIGHVYKVNIPDEYIVEHKYSDTYIETGVNYYYIESGQERTGFLPVGSAYDLDYLFEN